MKVSMLTDHGNEDIKQIWLTYNTEKSQLASVLDVNKFGDWFSNH